MYGSSRTNPRKSPIKSPSNIGEQRRGGGGIPHRIVMALCLISFIIGYTYGVTSDYLSPVDSTVFSFQPPSSDETTGKNSFFHSLGGGGSSSSSGTRHVVIQEIAEELVANTLGNEMLNQRNMVSSEEMKKAFYNALSATIGTHSQALSLAAQQSRQEAASAAAAGTVPSIEKDFLAIAQSFSTAKVAAHENIEKCSKDENANGCFRKGCKNKRCIPFGYDVSELYSDVLRHLSRSDAEPFQALEIGFFRGAGYKTFEKFLPNADLHGIEITCLPHGPLSEGKWPWENNAAEDPQLYGRLIEKGRLHCGDATNINFLNSTWMAKMKNIANDPPPLKLVVDDGTHDAKGMATSLFFWFPRIEPGGYMVFEGIEPIKKTNLFRTQLIPQMMADIHYCGDPKFQDEGPCFPTIQPLLSSVHCSLNICIFKRNDEPANELSSDQSKVPTNALDSSQCPSLRR